MLPDHRIWRPPAGREPGRIRYHGSRRPCHANRRRAARRPRARAARDGRGAGGATPRGPLRRHGPPVRRRAGHHHRLAGASAHGAPRGRHDDPVRVAGAAGRHGRSRRAGRTSQAQRGRRTDLERAARSAGRLAAERSRQPHDPSAGGRGRRGAGVRVLSRRGPDHVSPRLVRRRGANVVRAAAARRSGPGRPSDHRVDGAHLDPRSPPCRRPSEAPHVVRAGSRWQAHARRDLAERQLRRRPDLGRVAGGR
jgi:hypothetical protein